MSTEEEENLEVEKHQGRYITQRSDTPPLARFVEEITESKNARHFKIGNQIWIYHQKE